MNQLISILLCLPLVGALAIPLLPTARMIRWTAFSFAVLTFLFSLALLVFFNTHTPPVYRFATGGGGMQLIQHAPLFPSLHIFYFVGLDGLSLPLIILTTFLFPLACAASWKIDRSPRSYFALLLLLECSLLGAFVSLDMILFFVFLQVSLLPVYVLLNVWGGTRKHYAAMKFAVFMLVSAAGMLAATVMIDLTVHSFDMLALPALLAERFSSGNTLRFLAPLIFCLILFAVLIRSPGVPLHTWLIDVQVNAPVAVSMLLPSLMLNAGAYAMFRVVYPFFPEVARHLWLLIAVLGVVTILYGALCAMAQNELKRLLTYISISQMGFVLVGASIMTPAALNGAIFLMISHGLISAMIFLIAGVLTDRLPERDLNGLGGLASTMPRFFGFSAFAFFGMMGLPLLCGFVGEILILLGIFQAARPDAVIYASGLIQRGKLCTLAILAIIGLVITAGCLLRTLQRIFFGPPHSEQRAASDVDGRESAILGVLVGAAILLGVLPNLFVFSMTATFVDRAAAARAFIQSDHNK